MPIGKNSIKRVQNNGYSNVKTDAPDMENSTVLKAEPTKVTPGAEKPAKPTVQKAAPKKKAEPTSKKAAKPAPRTAAKKTEKPEPKPKPEREGSGYVNLGGELPIYLL